MLLLQLRCRWCELVFYICRCCFRGQAYCCDECRIAGQRQNHREAQRKYRQTEKGKKAHRQAENRRRYGLSQKSQKNMDDASSTVLQGCVPNHLGITQPTVSKSVWRGEKLVKENNLTFIEE